MAKFEIKLDNEGMRELLESAAVEAELVGRMSAVQAALPGSEMQVLRQGRRVQVRVVRGSDYEEANTGELSRALSKAGGRRGNGGRRNPDKWLTKSKKSHG